MKRNVVLNLAARDLAACLAVSDAHKAADTRARAGAQRNVELVAVLTLEAARRGDPSIDWAGYFSRAGLGGGS